MLLLKCEFILDEKGLSIILWQLSISVFTAWMTKIMTCFVAETMILTATGLLAIENIKVGDIVISTNSDIME